MLSIKEVKQQLPMVKVKWAGRLYYGRVSGRLNQFATVSPYQVINPHSKLIHTIIGPCYHFSWDSVTNAINHNHILICDDN